MVETFDGARPARSPSPTRIRIDTPHDHRGASRLAMLIAFVSPHAPEQERDVLTTSADSLQSLHPHPPLASSPPKKRVVFAPDDNTGCPPPPPPHGRPVRDPKIPIGPAQPNRAPSFPRFPPYEAFGRRPRAQSQRACKGPASETLQLSGHFKSRVALSMRGHGPGKVSCALSRAAKRAESRERRRWQRHCRNRSRFFV
jgi:hypothetical protein